MTPNQTINTALLSIGSFFAAQVAILYPHNFWYAIVAAIIAIGAFVLYELLP